MHTGFHVVPKSLTLNGVMTNILQIK